MNRISLVIKLGFLMTLAVLLVSAAGYLTYNNLSAIVASIEVKSRPDLSLRKTSSGVKKATHVPSSGIPLSRVFISPHPVLFTSPARPRRD